MSPGTATLEKRGDDARARSHYTPIASADPEELTHQLKEWHFEFTGLRPGKFAAQGGTIQLDDAIVSRVVMDGALLHRGEAPRGTTGIFLAGHGSEESFVGGQQLESSQCVTMADGGCLDGISRGRYVDVSLAVDRSVWNTPSSWLSECSLTTNHGTRIEQVSPLWKNHMLDTVDWMFAAIETHPEAMARPDVQASLRDQFVAAMASFHGSRTPFEHRTRDARARQRIAVERARQYIRAKLSEPLRLSELCNYARVQSRSLEYGFREVTGLSPIAYVKTLRLNAVRRVLTAGSDRSISEIALDHGFWHLSQFAVDYRRFFGETPSSTRKRRLTTHRTQTAGLRFIDR